MSSKYATLPDIDTQPDVYETAETTGDAHIQGFEDQDQFSDEDDDEEREVIRSHLSIKGAASKFRNTVVDTKDADFSDALTRRKKLMYRTYTNRRANLPGIESSEYEVLPRELTLQETPLQKLRRLMFETQELGDEVEKRDSNASSTMINPLQTQLSNLQSDLTRISQALNAAPAIDRADGTLARQMDDAKGLIRGLEAYKKGIVPAVNEVKGATPAGEAEDGKGKNFVTYELYYSPETARLHVLTKAAEMDDRIAKLEKLVGASQSSGYGEVPTPTTTTPLINTIEKLEQQLGLLTQPRQLDSVTRRTKMLIGDLEKMQDLKAKAAAADSLRGAGTDTISEETEEKINRLFQTLDKVDPFLSLTPVLLARLKALQQLHTEAATFSESIKMLAFEQGKWGEEIRSLTGVTERLEQSFKENDAAIQQNVQIVDGRISDLVKRLEKLK